VSAGVDVFVAAGSNVEPIEHLRRALDVLERHFAPLRVSTAYSNRAVGFEGDDFVNLVVQFQTALQARDVLPYLHEAEAACGRPRHAPKWAPRTMDLDMLLYDALVLDEPGLTLPRPDLLRRPYMLGPAAELRPAFVHPVARRTLGELWLEMQARETHALRAVALDWPPRAAL
jgi:2-amino-4-hydroxy-6-hydroxymethyldihydropteridine diphosphokinase